jgi:DNA-binding NarL/FixJ family response regulator
VVRGIVPLSQLFSRLNGHRRDEQAVSALSERQRQVLECVLTGATNKEIAGDLGVSEQCIKYHVGRLFKKFGVDTRVALAVAASEIVRRDRPPRDG